MKRSAGAAADIEEVCRLLEQKYGTPQVAERAPLDVLVETILSQNTNDTNSHEAFVRLRSRFPKWAQVAEAPAADVEDAVRVAGLAATKARTIQHALRTLPRDEEGEPTLTELAAISDDDAAEAALTAFPGVGPKTASCTLLFGLRRSRFPVDTHVFRVSSRLGLVSGAAAASRVAAQASLERRVPPPLKLPMHLLLITHGRRCCKPSTPNCDDGCVLCDICPRIGVRRTAKKKKV